MPISFKKETKLGKSTLSPKICIMDSGICHLFLKPTKPGQSTRICLMVRMPLHQLQSGTTWGLLIKYLWVMWVWPMRSLFKTRTSLTLAPFIYGQGLMQPFIDFNLVLVVILLQTFWNLSMMQNLIEDLVSL